eukprot:ANDGO_01761.mRNA.1 hypothetical protein ACA1_134270
MTSLTLVICFCGILAVSTLHFSEAQGVVACGFDISERWTIKSPEGIEVSVSRRTAGAIDSVVFRNRQFINACDHGRELQMAVTTTIGECYNPTEAGASKDGYGTHTSSEILKVNKDGNALHTSIMPAFWMWPGTCEKACGCAQNTEKTSKYQMDKTVSFNPFGVSQSFRYLASVHVPENITHLQIESPTGYMTGDFSKFYSFDADARNLTHLPSPGQSQGLLSQLPVILSTQDDTYAMGAMSRFPVVGYAYYDFSGLTPYQQSTTKWSIVRIWNGPIAEGTVMDIDSFMCVGTTQEVASCMTAIHKAFQP